MRWTASCVLLATLTGCGISEVVYVDARFTPDEQVDIQAASDEWERATGVGIDMVFNVDVSDSSGRRVMIRATSIDQLKPYAQKSFTQFPGRSGQTEVHRDKYVGMKFGVTWEEIIILVPRIKREDFRALVTHEFGHHLMDPNKSHSLDPEALMNQRMGADCVTRSDAALYCSALNCDPSTIKACR